MTTITGSNDNDLLTGTAGNDTINSGNGDDSVSGGAGNDSLNGGAGADTLDGGSGSDQLNGGSGSDTLIYSVSENIAAGTRDVYTGGSGVDALELLFTRAQWLESSTQTQIAAYLAHLSAVTNARTGEVSNGSASDFTFTFGSSTLTVQMTEVLRVLVDGVEVNPANEAVNALDDQGTTTEDGPGVQIYVLQNDEVPDLVKSLTLASAPTRGTATLVQPAMDDPSTWYFQYQPNVADFQYLAAGESATDTFTYEVKDADGGTGLATVTVTIIGTNDAPVAVADVKSGNEDTLITGTVATNDSDIDEGATLIYSLNAPVAGLTINANGGYSFDAGNAAYQNLAQGATTDVVANYTVTDEHGETSTSTLTITLTGTNDAPVAVADVKSGNEDTLITGTVATNDSDIDEGATLIYSLNAPVAGLTINANGGYSFDAGNAAYQNLAQGATTDVVANYTVTDEHGETSTSTLTITLTGTNDAPVAVADVKSGNEDTLITGTVATNDSDIDEGATLIYSLNAPVAGLTINANGSYSFDAGNAAYQNLAQGATTDVVANYTVTDEHGETSTSTLTITLTGTNDAPVAVADVKSGNEDTLITGTVATNDSDIDEGATLIYSLNAPVAGLTINANGSYSFDAGNAAYQNLAQGATTDVVANYTVTDEHGETSTSTLTITLTGTNDVPVLSAAATPVLASVNEDAGVPVGAVGTLVSSLVDLNPPTDGLDNVSDADNGALTGIALTGANATNGSWWYSTDGGANWATVGAVSDASALLLAADANTRVYFQGNSNFSGTVSDGITFRAWDQTSGTAGTTVSTVTNGGSSAFSNATDTANITVQADNENPVTASDVLYVSNSTLVTLPTSVLLGNDTDIDGAALSVTAISVVAGTLASPVTINANGTFSFTTGATGGTVASPTVVTLSYTLSDGADGTATGAVTLNVLDTTSVGNTVNLAGVANYQGSYIDGKDGNDTLRDGAFQSVLVGSSGNDQLSGNAGSDLLIGGDNVDTLSGGAGNDVLRGGAKNDEIDGGAGTEDLIDFSDATGSTGIIFTLTQSGSNTTFNGPSSLGTDTYRNIEGVIGTANADTLTGSASNDILRGGAGNDTLDGAGGNADLLDFSDGTAGLTFTLMQSSSATSFDAGAAGLGTDSYRNFEGVIGTAFADTITGSVSADQLRGGGGNDVINGLAGDDRIVGGTGADTLTGGADNDTFVFDSAPNAVDSVTDFDASGSAASGDLVELSLGTFTALSTASGSTLSATEFASVNGSGAGDAVAAGVRVIYDSATGSLYYDSDGLDAANRTLMATVTLSNPGDTFDNNDIKIGA